MKIKRILTISVLFFVALNVSAQIDLTSYSVYSLGVGINRDKRIGGELKSFLNNEIYNLSLEAALMYNFKARNYHRFSVGLGVNFSPFTGGEDEVEGNAFTFPCQLEIFPLQNFKQLSFVMEFAPLCQFTDEWAFRYFWGIRYTFKK